MGVRAQRLNIHDYAQIDGNPIGQVYAVHQDRRGYIWIGSGAGLGRYDGRRYHAFSSADGLVSNTVVLIDEQDDGTLVLATQAGLCFMDGYAAHPSATCLTPDDGLLGGPIRDLELDPDSSIWVASDFGVSLVRGDRVVRTFSVADGLPSEEAESLARDEGGTLWAATSAGLARLSGDHWEAMPTPAGSRPLVLELDASGFFAGGRGELLHRVEGRWESVPVDPSTGSISHVDRAPDGTLWIAEGRNLQHLGHDGPRRYTTEHGLPGQGIWDVMVDREGNVWMATDGGLFKVVPGPFDAFSEQQGLPHPFVRALTETGDGTLWFGTRDGLAVWRGGGMVEVPFAGIAPDPRIFALAQDPSGGLLVGTAGGLVLRRPDGSLDAYDTSDGLPHNVVFSLEPDGEPDGEGGVWVGTNAGLARWRAGTIRPFPVEGAEDATIIALEKDTKGRLWVGLAADGLRVLDGDSVAVLDEAAGLSDQTVWDLAPDGAGGMWVGTNGDGAYHVSGEGDIRRLTHDDGLVDDFIWQVGLDRGGAVWLYTTKGLNRVRDGVVTYYGTADGLTDLEGSAGAFLEDRAGNLWFGAGLGVFRFTPSRDRQFPPPPRVALESVTAGGNPVSGGRLVFAPRAEAITFVFSVPTYRDEAGMRFRHRFAGGDEGWSSASATPEVSFARLGHGSYTLEVVAETDQGVQSSENLAIPFTVLPSWWQTAWFRGLVALVILALLIGTPLLRGRRLEAERARLQALVLERTGELESKTRHLEAEIDERARAEEAREQLRSQLWDAQKMKLAGRLAGGVAHDFNNLLTVVRVNAELLSEEVPDNPEVQSGLLEIKTSADHGVELVSHLLAFSQRQVVCMERLDLVHAFRDGLVVIERMMTGRLDVRIRVPDGPLWVSGDRGQLNQALVNVALNAQDAMPEGGTLEVALATRKLTDPLEAPFCRTVPPGPYAVLTVTDSGEGMDTETLSRAFEPFFTTRALGDGTGLGLSTVYGIVETHRGYIHLASAPGEGTEVALYLPLLEDRA